ncbi:MAG: hypothetical protein IKZ35_01965 [Clostridia bacterium]|nr:hypothetical protein [Clostridia bacterium]
MLKKRYIGMLKKPLFGIFVSSTALTLLLSFITWLLESPLKTIIDIVSGIVKVDLNEEFVNLGVMDSILNSSNLLIYAVCFILLLPSILNVSGLLKIRRSLKERRITGFKRIKNGIILMMVYMGISSLVLLLSVFILTKSIPSGEILFSIILLIILILGMGVILFSAYLSGLYNTVKLVEKGVKGEPVYDIAPLYPVIFTAFLVIFNIIFLVICFRGASFIYSLSVLANVISTFSLLVLILVMREFGCDYEKITSDDEFNMNVYDDKPSDAIQIISEEETDNIEDL